MIQVRNENDFKQNLLEDLRSKERNFREMMFYGQKMSKREKMMLTLQLDDLLDATMLYHRYVGKEEREE